MATYKNDTLTEQSIYGSSRLGLINYASKTAYRSLGGKKYELSNHLGNVLAVVTDNIHLDQDSTWASVVNVTDYYPFGLAMDGRSVQDSTYRYGFNGKEEDSAGEWGSKSHYDYGFRIYNPSIAKFLSVDPLSPSYPWYTPYQFAGNKPIWAIDLDGLEEFRITQNSFAPWEEFGSFFGVGGYKFAGDKRGFSRKTTVIEHGSSNGVTARVHQKALVDMTKGTAIQLEMFSSETEGNKFFFGDKSNKIGDPSGNMSFSNGSLSMRMEGSNPLVLGVAPDIDWKTSAQFNLEDNGRTLSVSGVISGKGFPAYENFIEDANGTSVFLGVIPSPDRDNLELELIPNIYDRRQSVNFKFSLDSDGNFTGDVQIGIPRRQGRKKWLEWQSTTIDELNNQAERTPAASDCAGDDCK